MCFQIHTNTNRVFGNTMETSKNVFSVCSALYRVWPLIASSYWNTDELGLADWTGKFSSKTSDLESAEVRGMACSPTTAARELYVQLQSSATVMAMLRKKPWKKLSFGDSWRLAGLSRRSWPTASVLWLPLPGLFPLFLDNLVGFTRPLFHHSRVKAHTHVTTWPASVEKGGSTIWVSHLAPISRRYKDRIRTNKKINNSLTFYVQYAQNPCCHTTGFIAESTNQHKTATGEQHCNSTSCQKATEVWERQSSRPADQNINVARLAEHTQDTVVWCLQK